MIIREASVLDIPSIVELLKLSLGESLLPKSEAYWRWKHIENPFGESLVLLAEENNKLIGVRAFMQWRWKQKDKIYKSLRAVDTATHPEYQGRGIFRKLTLTLVEEAQKMGFDFIFNTPNNKSKPGYLKMGWQSNGKYPIRVIPVQMMNLLLPLKKTMNLDKPRELSEEAIKFIIDVSKQYNQDRVTTEMSFDYLVWRYLKVPNLTYNWYYSPENGWIVFYRIKESGRRKELRIGNILWSYEADLYSFKRYIKKEAKKYNLNMVALGANDLGSFKPGYRINIGPELTFRKLSLDSPPLDWAPAMGDLELF